MKRAGNLMPLVADMDNLQEAFLRAARGKSDRIEVISFRENLQNELLQIQKDLLEGSYTFGEYKKFTIFEPKERVICAAQFRDRVTFHALMCVCHSTFENFQVYHSYASRIGKGTYKAVEQAKKYASRYKWFAKLDVRHYFDSIDHQILLRLLCRLFKDERLILLFQNLLDTYQTEKDKGLPIGNLTSQYFANHYLAVADHYFLEHLRVKAMVRYMDDFLLFCDDKEMLKDYVSSVVRFMKDELSLELHEPVVNKTSYGVPFLGYVVKPEKICLNQQSRSRFRKKVRRLDEQYKEGVINEIEYRIHYEPLRTFVNKANSKNFVRKTGNISVGL